jgi:hypothetical protein
MNMQNETKGSTKTKRQRTHSILVVQRIVVPGIAAFLVVACSSSNAPPEGTASVSSPIYGTSCPTPKYIYMAQSQDDFQNNWQPNMSGDGAAHASNFIAQMNACNWTESGYYNLHGAQPYFETTCADCATGIDTVDMQYVVTHGGYDSQRTYWAMWDVNALARSDHMRLGGGTSLFGPGPYYPGLSVLNTHSCFTAVTSDGHAWNRWYSIFAGGLIIANAAHGSIYSGNTQEAFEFGVRMENGEPLGQAWNEALWYADNRNGPSTMNTGYYSNGSDCWQRMGTTLSSFPTKIRDSNIGYMCWSGWNGS